DRAHVAALHVHHAASTRRRRRSGTYSLGIRRRSEQPPLESALPLEDARPLANARPMETPKSPPPHFHYPARRGPCCKSPSVVQNGRSRRNSGAMSAGGDG